MKFEHNPKYTTISIYAVIVLAIVLVFNQALQSMGILYDFLGRMIGFVRPVVYGIVIAFLLNPLLRFFDDRLLARIGNGKLKRTTRRTLGLLLTYLMAILFIVAFVNLALPQIVQSLSGVFSNIGDYIDRLTKLYNDILDWLESSFSDSKVTADIIRHLEGFISSIQGSLYALPKQTFTAVLSFTTGLTAGIINMVFGLIISIYILSDREKLFAQMKKIGSALFSEDTYNLLYDISMDINRIFSGFVIGKVIDSLIMGILCFIGMTILRLDYAALISVIVGVTNIIPYFGPFIGAIPGFLILFIASPIKGIWFAAFILLLQQLDGNIIGPKILGDTVGLSPLWIIFSIMLFSGMLGVIGMFIGVPLFALIYSIIKRFISYLLRRKGKSVSTRDYASDENPLLR